MVVADQHVVAEHPRAWIATRSSTTGSTTCRWSQRKPGALRNGAPFADLPDPLQRLRRALLRHEGGDKVMARVLMAVPAHGLDAVLVAVELVLESGRPSADHVLNVVARLNDGPRAALGRHRADRHHRAARPIRTATTRLHEEEAAWLI